MQNGVTALMRAASTDCYDCLRLLVEAGADLHIKSATKDVRDEEYTDFDFQQFSICAWRAGS